jgi:hypothetical protein
MAVPHPDYGDMDGSETILGLVQIVAFKSYIEYAWQNWAISFAGERLFEVLFTLC